MITAKAPGKLYIAGEYAVMEKGYPSIIVALDQFVTVNIEKSKDYGTIISKQYKENLLYWKREGSQIVFDNRDNPFHYIISAIKLVEEYAQSLKIPLDVYHLKVNSQLDSPDGKKYGLGSSAAVTVATIKALCKFYHIPLNLNQLFKLASIAHLEVQGNGSLGDIAASVYGGWIAYSSFDKEWLKNMRKVLPLPILINKNWPFLKINTLTPPSNLKLLIGWSGSPASTSHLVDKVELKKLNQSNSYKLFLEESKKCIENMIKGFHTGNLKLIKKQINYNRKIILNLSSFTHVNIETPSLRRLCDIAVSNGGAAKSSGAGGGDCGIVVIEKDKSLSNLFNSWNLNNIKRLKLKINNPLFAFRSN